MISSQEYEKVPFILEAIEHCQKEQARLGTSTQDDSFIHEND
jgi:hypothetical protein